jgi:hypothetical protein
VPASIAVRRCAIVAAAAVFALLFAPKAHAGLLVSSATSCDDNTLSQPFAPWLDNAHYFSLSDFENGASDWALTGGAAVTSGNEPWQVGGAGDSQSLSIPSGASATSQTVCVGIDSPSVRFFARRDAHGLLGFLSTLRVDALVVDNLGNTVTVPVFSTGGGSSWAPTLPMPVLASLLPVLPGDHTPIAFKFTAVGSADWHIDDTYVDPWHCC